MQPNNPEPVFPDAEALSNHQHTVQFYSDESFLLETLSRFMGAAVGAGDAGVVIATAAHRDALARRLEERGVDVLPAVEQGRYVALDAAETLQRFMVDGWPDEKLFVECVGGVITRAQAAAKREHGRAALFGEMVALLWEQGKPEAALRLEQLWNNLAQSHSFSLVCAYPLHSFYGEGQGDAFLRVCSAHSAVIPAEGYTQAPAEERMRTVAHLQQRSMNLDSEIDQRRNAELEATKLAAIVESSDDAIVSKDVNGIVKSWNPGAERMFGYNAAEMVGQSITKIIPPEYQQDEEMILGRIRRGERVDHFETIRMTKDGRRIEVSVTVSPVKDAAGRVIGAAKIARDITERKRAEQALRRTEKLAATGQLAASIAHEINNPMQALSNLLALLSYRRSLDQDTLQLVALAESELGRMSHISRQMLSFYRESVTPVPVEMAAVLEDVLELFAMRMRSNNIRVERRYQDVQAIHAFPVEMRQLFSNLVGNALDAVGERGRIVVRVREASARGGRGVRVTIADSGPGIAPHLRARIFEPFFSTKAEKGTGLGLWVVKGIVAKHEGHMCFRSSTRAGKSGTVFSVFLPAAVASARAVSAGVERSESVA